MNHTGIIKHTINSDYDNLSHKYNYFLLRNLFSRLLLQVKSTKQKTIDYSHLSLMPMFCMALVKLSLSFCLFAPAHLTPQTLHSWNLESSSGRIVAYPFLYFSLGLGEQDKQEVLEDKHLDSQHHLATHSHLQVQLSMPKISSSICSKEVVVIQITQCYQLHTTMAQTGVNLAG